MQVKVQKSTSTTLPRRPAGVNGGELSHPVAPAREGNEPSTGNWTAAGCIVARKSWLAFMRNVFHSFASWSICLSSVTVDLDDGLGEGLGCFLRQVVPDTAPDSLVRIFARELLGIGAAVRVWCTVGITFKGNGGHGDDRTFGKPPLELVVLRLAFSQAQPPAVVVDHDADMIRIVQRGCAAIKRSVIELPFRRSRLPNELGKIVPVLVVACPAAFRGEIILVPPCELGRWRQW